MKNEKPALRCSTLGPWAREARVVAVGGLCDVAMNRIYKQGQKEAEKTGDEPIAVTASLDKGPCCGRGGCSVSGSGRGA